MIPEDATAALQRKVSTLEERLDAMSRRVEADSRIHLYETVPVDFSDATTSFHYIAADNAQTCISPLWLPGKIALRSAVAYITGHASYAGSVAIAIYRVDRPDTLLRTDTPSTIVNMTASPVSLPSRTFTLVRTSETKDTTVDGAPVAYPVRVVFDFPRGLELDPTRNMYAVAWQSFISASASPRVVMWMGKDTWFSTTIGSMTYDTSLPNPSWLAGYTPTKPGDFPPSIVASPSSTVGTPTIKLLSSRATGVLIR